MLRAKVGTDWDVGPGALGLGAWWRGCVWRPEGMGGERKWFLQSTVHDSVLINIVL